MREFLWNLAKRSALAAVISISFADAVGSVAQANGTSMEPTLNPGTNDLMGVLKGDVVFFEKFSAPASGFSRDGISRGDVVVVRSPQEPNQLIVKRLIALQGDWINVPQTYEILQIPKGHCWVEGDNGKASLDSRIFGPIPLALVEGRVTHKIWPPNRVGRVERIVPAGRVIAL